MTRGAWQRCLWPYACPTRSADDAPRRIKLHCVTTGGTMSRVSHTQCKQLWIGLSRSRCYLSPAQIAERSRGNVPAGTPWPPRSLSYVVERAVVVKNHSAEFSHRPRRIKKNEPPATGGHPA